MNTPYIFKKCTECNEWLIASKTNFYKKKNGKYGLESICKKCKQKHRKQHYENNKEKTLEKNKQWWNNNKKYMSEYQKQYYQDNKEQIAERSKQYRQDNKEQIAERSKKYYQDNKEQIAERSKKYNKQYYQDNKEQVKERKRQHYQDNKEQVKERKRQHYQDNKEQEIKRVRQYQEDHKEQIKERTKKYRQSPQGQISQFNANNRRRQREQQGRGITTEQWLEMMNFFNWCGAYSGIYIGGKDNNRSIDHIVALDNGGLNEPWNCVPMERSLNSNKRTRDMLEWYKEQPFYSEERLAKIYEWQEYAFNKWGQDVAM